MKMEVLVYFMNIVYMDFTAVFIKVHLSVSRSNVSLNPGVQQTSIVLSRNGFCWATNFISLAPVLSVLECRN